MTRDRKVLTAEWAGVPFSIMDTGGWLAGGDALDAKVSQQAERALAEADVVLMVVDVTTGVTERGPGGGQGHPAGRRTRAAGGQQGRRRQPGGRSLGVRLPRAGRSVPGQRPARAGHGRPPRRGGGAAAGATAADDAAEESRRRPPARSPGHRGARHAPGGHHRATQRREVDALQPAAGRGALDRPRHAGHHPRRHRHRGRDAGRPGLLHRHRRPAAAVQDRPWHRAARHRCAPCARWSGPTSPSS